MLDPKTPPRGVAHTPDPAVAISGPSSLRTYAQVLASAPPATSMGDFDQDRPTPAAAVVLPVAAFNTFKPFPRLPRELRDLIWRAAVPSEGRTIEVLYSPDRGFYPGCAIPESLKALLQGSPESRECVLESYKQITVRNETLHITSMGGEAGEAHKPVPNESNEIVPFRTYINHDRDTFYFGLSSAVEPYRFHQPLSRQHDLVSSFLRSLPEGSLPLVQHLIFDGRIALGTRRNWIQLLPQCPNLNQVSLVVSDRCLPKDIQNSAAMKKNPPPHFELRGLEPSRDTRKLVRWCCQDGCWKAMVVGHSMPSWEAMMECAVGGSKDYMRTLANDVTDLERYVWSRIKFSYINVVRDETAFASYIQKSRRND